MNNFGCGLITGGNKGEAAGERVRRRRQQGGWKERAGRRATAHASEKRTASLQRIIRPQPTTPITELYPFYSRA